MNFLRGIGWMIGAFTCAVLDRRHPPAPLYGYSSMDYYADND